MYLSPRVALQLHLIQLLYRTKIRKVTLLQCVHAILSCVDFCNHHCNQVASIILSPQRSSLFYHFIVKPSSLTSICLFSSSIILALRECYIDGIIQYESFEIGFFFPTQPNNLMPLTHPICCVFE